MSGSVVEYDGDLPAIPGHVSWEEPTAHLVRESPGEYGVMVKVIDIFGNDTSKIVRVKVS